MESQLLESREMCVVKKVESRRRGSGQGDSIYSDGDDGNKHHVYTLTWHHAVDSSGARHVLLFVRPNMRSPTAKIAPEGRTQPQNKTEPGLCRAIGQSLVAAETVLDA